MGSIIKDKKNWKIQKYLEYLVKISMIGKLQGTKLKCKENFWYIHYKNKLLEYEKNPHPFHNFRILVNHKELKYGTEQS